MKKVLSLLLVIIPLFLFSQNKTQKQKVAEQSNSAVLKSFSDRSKIVFFQEKSKANDMAKKFNWPLTLKKDNTFSELVGVSKDNLPIYYSTFNEGAGITSRANKLHSGGSLGLNINGENITAGVWDGGAGLTTHELFSGRLQVLDNTQNTHPHSTHVAGTIIGSKLFENGKATGMAHNGKVNSYDWNNDIGEVATAAADGLLLSNHSYGRNPNGVAIEDWGKYDIKSQGYDEIMFNAPYYQFVCAAGNSRGNFNTTKNGFDVITGHGLSKNGITVAAVKEVLNYTGANSVEMSVFSSWGPTDDGRIKPDISAKGVDTYSSLDGSNSSYGTYSGTSMASPSVVGTLMLYQQYYNDLNGNFMKASTLRGLMIHTADEAGPAKGPDYGFGWGLINAEKAADVIKKNQTQSFILENTLTQNNSYSITVNSNGIEPLLATLCWTDPQGNLPDAVIDSSNPELINDLDIRITQNSNTTLPWKLDVANPSSVANRGDNLVDNVEKVEVENAVGSYTITITNKGTLVNNLQDYSLIVSGINVKDFWLTTNQKTKSICEGIASVSYVFDLKTKTNFNETVTYSTIGLPAGITATFNPTSMSAAGSFGLTLSDLTFLLPGRYTFDVKATTATDSFEIPITIVVLTPTFQNLVLSEPSNNATNVVLPVIFNWQEDVNAQQFEIEIASNSNFSTIIQTATVNSNSFKSSILLNNSTYFWRVKPKNSCNSGVFSTPISFSTVCKLPTNIVQLSASTTTASLGWTENSGGTSWLVEVVPEGVLPTGNGTLITTNTYSLSGLTPNTCYDFYIKSNCNLGTSSWTKKTKFCTQPDYCAGDHFVDSGGLNGNYSNFENKTTTIFPVNSGDRIKAVFNSFNIETGWDFLRIFNGPNENYPLLFSGTGTYIPAYFASSDATGALTFKFTSDNVGTSSGWDATIICEPMPACPIEPNNISISNLTYNSAKINWIENTNATSWNIEIVASGTTPTGIGTSINTKPFSAISLTPNTSYNVYIQSNCIAGTSSWSTPFSFRTPGNYCAGDNFYDDGGATGNYSQNSFQQTIYPDNAGDRIKVIFNTFDINNYDSFYVYNGINNNSQLLYNSNNNNINPETLKATNLQGALTFIFYNYGFNNKTGWDATVVCETLPPCPNSPSNFMTNSGENENYINISWNENSGASQWEIEIIPQGNTPTGNGIIVANNNYNKTGLASNTWYDYYVRSKCSNGNSEWSAKQTFYTKANYCAGDHFYDNGGPNGNYLNEYNYEKTIFPNGFGNRVKAIFNNLQLATGATITIYNGYSYNSPILYSGNSLPPNEIIATNQQGILTFRLNRQSNLTSNGWDATIVCEPLPPCSNRPSSINVNYITTTSATFSWYENSNATSWEFEIVPQGTTPTGIGTITTSNPYTKTGLTSNTWYDFYIRSICGSVNSEWTLKTTFNTKGNYCAGDNFYDNGGPNGNLVSNGSQYETIYPTGNGNRVKATFNSFLLSQYTTFKIYNGSNTSLENELFSYNGSNSPSTITATNPQGALTFYYYDYSNVASQGWNATIVCEPLPPCSSKPSNININNLTTNSATFGWIDNSNATSWEVEIVPHGTIPTGIGIIITSNPYTKIGLTSNTWYDFYIRSICGNINSDWALKRTFNTEANYCAGDHFYDNGGPNANYPQNDYNYQKTIYPTGNGNRIKATFNTLQLAGGDSLTILNGTNYNSPILFRGNTMPTNEIIATNQQGILTFILNRQSNLSASGWDATIVCEPLPPCSNAPSNISIYSITTNSATFNWYENSNATSWEIEIVPQGTTPTGTGTIITSNPYTKTGLTSNTWYDFYIRSICGSVNSAWTLKKTFNTESNYCAGDHFYDDGGPNANYIQNNYNYQKTIYPSGTGNRIKAVFNSFQLSSGDSLTILNGANYDSPILFNDSTIPTTEIAATNPQGVLTFKLNRQSIQTAPGWDATIVCEPLPPCSNEPNNIFVTNTTTTSASFNWNENSNATSWEVKIVPKGTTLTGSGTITNLRPYTKTGLTSNTWYDFYVRSRCGSVNSIWTLKTTFNTKANFCAGDHFYDNGGPNGNLVATNSNQNITIYPTGIGNRVKANFNSFSLAQYVDFKVYNGTNTNTENEIFAFNGNNFPTVLTATNPQGALTFSYYDYYNSFSEGWDATIVCEPLPPCSNAPSNINISNISDLTANINWTENSNATSWEVEFVVQGTNPTGIGTIINSKPYSKTGLTSNTWYDFYVRSKCGNVNSAWSLKKSFNTLANYCAGDHFYDNGGPNGNLISNNGSQYVTIYPTGTGNRLKATFNTFLLNQYTTFKIFNGTSTNSQDELFSYNGNNFPSTVTATNQLGALTFYYYENSNSTSQGWDATIVCEPLPPCANLPSNVYVNSITTNSANISWTENSNATSWEVEFVVQGNNPTGIGTIVNSNQFTKTGLTSNTWYDFYVRSKCGSVNSAWTLKTSFNTEANYCAGDHFYDNGGPNGNYNNNNGSFYKTIYPTGTGNRIVATFNSFQIGQNDSFDVYDGNNLIFSRNGNNPISPTTLIATNPQGYLTFQFYGNSNQTFAGWDATIVCEPLPPCANPPSSVYTYSIETTSASFNWTENANATSWEVEFVSQGTTPTGIGTIITSNPYTKTGLTSNTWYDFYVRSKCGNVNSAWTLKKSFNTEANYCGGDHFYDNGGPNGNYNNNNGSFYKTIYPTGTGNRIVATFNSFQIGQNDSFDVYDGNNLIFSRNGNNPISPTTLTATNPQGYLTFQFYGNSNQTFVGWDATIVCEPLPPCSNAPTNAYIYNVTTNSATINWTENSNATSWEVEFVQQGTIPTGIGTIITSNPFNKTGLTSNTWYDFYVRSKCGNVNSSWALKKSFNTDANYCSGDHFYDNGGPNGNYNNNNGSFNKTIYPTGTGNRVKATFNTFQISPNASTFKVYDGSSSNSPELFVFNGINSPQTIAATNPQGILTFYFYDYSGNTYSGWDATIICEPLPPCSSPPNDFHINTTLKDGFNIGWTELSNATSWELEIIPFGNQPTGIGTIITTNNFTVNGLSENTCYSMYLRSICGNQQSNWVSMLNKCTIPNYCNGTRLYDSGGENGAYQNNEDYKFTIFPNIQNAKVQVLFNSFQTESCCDYLKIYNGPTDSSPLLYNAYGTNFPGTLISTHSTGALSFTFHSDISVTGTGWDISVNCGSVLATEQDDFENNLIEYFPNPVLDLLNIKSRLNIDKYEVYDINSRLIDFKNVNKQEFIIDSSKFSSGIYFVKLFDNDGNSKDIKFIKK